jgi:hypothetical protein
MWPEKVSSSRMYSSAVYSISQPKRRTRDIGEQAGRFYPGPLVGQFGSLGELCAR